MRRGRGLPGDPEPLGEDVTARRGGTGRPLARAYLRLDDSCHADVPGFPRGRQFVGRHAHIVVVPYLGLRYAVD